jgi:hypothetical protein
MERETLNERETQKNVRFPLGDPSSSLSMGYLQYSEGSFFFKFGVFTMVQVQVPVHPRPSGRPYESAGNF